MAPRIGRYAISSGEGSVGRPATGSDGEVDVRRIERRPPPWSRLQSSSEGGKGDP